MTDDDAMTVGLRERYVVLDAIQAMADAMPVAREQGARAALGWMLWESANSSILAWTEDEWLRDVERAVKKALEADDGKGEDVPLGHASLVGLPRARDGGTMITFSIPGRAPAAMSPNARKFWATKHSASREYGELVWAMMNQWHAPHWTIVTEANRMGAPWQRAHVTVTQRAVRLRDHDNFIASFKPGLDAIVRAGIILDDNPSVIDLTVRAEKCAKKADECVVVTIEEIRDGQRA